MRQDRWGAQQKAPRRLAFLGLVALMLLVMGLPGPVGAGAPETPGPRAAKLLEDLHYRVDFWFWPDALKTRVTFRELEPGRYRAEVAGEAQGMLATVSGNWRGSFSTEMKYSEGKLLPVIYREESANRGKRYLSEYRFDYEKGKVELYKLSKGKGLAKRWETAFKEPLYDPLTFFYNQRLAGLQIGKGGETLKYSGIPYPKPNDIMVRVGGDGPEGRQIMVELKNRVFENESSRVYALLDPEGVPTKLWTRVMMFGKITVDLLPGGKRVKKEQLEAPREQARGERRS